MAAVPTNADARASEQIQDLPLVRSVPLIGGVNNRYAPQDIEDGFASELANCDLDDVTRPALAYGFTVIGSSTTGLSATNVRPSGLGYLNCNTIANRSLVIALTGSRLYKTTDTTTAWTAVTPDFDVSDVDVVMFQVADSLYIVSQDSALEVQQMAPAGTLTAGGDVNASPPKGCVDGCYFLNRPWLLKAGVPVELHYGKLVPGTASIATDFGRDGSAVASTLAGRLQLSPNIGSQPRAVRPWNETSLIVFFDSSVEEVLVNSADPQGNSARRVLEPRYGCAARDTVVVVGNEMFFLDQYGQFRSLLQTVNKAQQGVVSKPISDAARAEIPGSINKLAMSKCHAVVVDDKLKLYYPRGASTECNAVMTFDLANRNWTGPTLLARPVNKSVMANIRSSGGVGWEEFSTDGGTTPLTAMSKVYRWDKEVYTHNGTGYTFSETTKAYDFGSPHLDKQGIAFELEIAGDPSATMAVDVQLDENGKWEQLPGVAQIPESETDSFPLTSSSFPLTPDSFPLVSVTPSLTRKVWKLLDLPRYATARFYRFRIRSTSSGIAIQRVAYRMTAKIKPRPVLG